MVRFLPFLGLALALAGCPGPGDARDAATPGDASSIDAYAPAVDAFVTPTEDAGVVTDDAAAGEDAPATLDAPPLLVDASRDAGSTTGFTAEILDPYAYGNCFMGPPDPLTLFWNLRVTGPGGARVTIDRAALRIQNAARGYSETQTLTLTASSFVIPGSGTLDQKLRKESGDPAIPICTFCGDMVTGELEIDVSVEGGGTQTLRASIADVSCVF